MSEKWRAIAEFVGFLMVAMSLLFVAFQMKQDRAIAQAELNTSQLELFASAYLAGLESEAYLSMWSKLYATKSWETADLTDQEIAAAEVSALIWWVYSEATFEQYRVGLVSELAWKEQEIEIATLYDWPAYKAAFDAFYRLTPSGFTEVVDDIVSRD